MSDAEWILSRGIFWLACFGCGASVLVSQHRVIRRLTLERDEARVAYAAKLAEPKQKCDSFDDPPVTASPPRTVKCECHYWLPIMDGGRYIGNGEKR